MSRESSLQGSAPADPKAEARQLPIDHWDALFAAVTTSLKLSAAGPKLRAGLTEWPSRDATVMECVHQLELLHDSLRDERRRSDESYRQVAAL